MLLLSAVTAAAKPECPERPIAKFRVFDGHYLDENNQFGRYDAEGDIQYCKEVCSKKIGCRSFDHNKVGGQCWLSTESKRTKPEAFKNDDTGEWVYYERRRRPPKLDAPGYKVVSGRGLQGNNDCNYNGIWPGDCGALCNGAAWCRSFDYDSKARSCSLSAKSNDLHSTPLLNNPPYRYYEKKVQLLPGLDELVLAPAHHYPGHQLVNQMREDFVVGRAHSAYSGDMRAEGEVPGMECGEDEARVPCFGRDQRYYAEHKVQLKKGDVLLIRLRTSREANMLISPYPYIERGLHHGREATGLLEPYGPEGRRHGEGLANSDIMQDVRAFGSDGWKEGRMVFTAKEDGPVWIRVQSVMDAETTTQDMLADLTLEHLQGR